MLRSHPLITTRTALGIYFAINFLYLLTFPFPWFLPVPVPATLIISSVVGVLFAWGIYPRTSAVFLFVIYSAIVLSPNLSQLPQDRYLGWLLLLFAITPSEGKISERIRWGVWLITGLSYTVSGFNKLESPSWVNGEAMNLIVGNTVGRLPASPGNLVYKLINYVFLGWEIGQLPLAFFRQGRRFLWIMAVVIHVLSFFLLRINSVSLGMLIWSIFIWEIDPDIRGLVRSLFDSVRARLSPLPSPE